MTIKKIITAKKKRNSRKFRMIQGNESILFLAEDEAHINRVSLMINTTFTVIGIAMKSPDF